MLQRLPPLPAPLVAPRRCVFVSLEGRLHFTPVDTALLRPEWDTYSRGIFGMPILAIFLLLDSFWPFMAIRFCRLLILRVHAGGVSRFENLSDSVIRAFSTKRQIHKNRSDVRMRDRHTSQTTSMQTRRRICLCTRAFRREAHRIRYATRSHGLSSSMDAVRMKMVQMK